MFKLRKFYPEGFNPQQYWDDKYSQEHIAGKSSEGFKKQEFWPVMEKYLDKEGRYLDAGCGIGGWIIFLNEQGYGVEGVDIAARTVRALTEYDSDLKVRVAPITALPYPDDSFDGVLAIGTLEYVEDKVGEALEEVKRVLKDDGFFFIEVPVANFVRRLFYIPLKKIELMIRSRRGEKPVFSNYLFDRNELKKIIRDRGFELVEEKPHELPEPDSHYGLYIDWPFLRGEKSYRLNAVGRFLKMVFNTISPWAASTGVVIVARKRS